MSPRKGRGGLDFGYRWRLCATVVASSLLTEGRETNFECFWPPGSSPVR